MIYRNLLKELENWEISTDRKPLIIRGARQVGKTTLIEMFSKKFDQTVTLNLERVQERGLWEGNPSTEVLLRNIEVAKKVSIQPGKTLLFLDEIQYEPRAVRSLRYFYEEKPELHVIATGSLMEVALRNKGFSFPVGRVSFLYLYPLNFEEFLKASDHEKLVEELGKAAWNKPLAPGLEHLASERFTEYIYLGGMPEIIKHFLEKKNFSELSPLKEGLLVSFEEDVPKYTSSTQVASLQFLIRNAPLFAGQRIKYTRFGNSEYQSREMKRAFEILEQAMIVQRVLPTVQTTPPMQPHLRASPKLLYLDSGLIAHSLNLQPNDIRFEQLNDLFRGTLAEQIVGQELMAQDPFQRRSLSFWFRNVAGSTAEVDYCMTLRGKIIPIEVKSGKTGRLRSLFQFMETAPHPYAVRIYSGPLQVDEMKTSRGADFYLLSVPFFLTYRLKEIVEDWMGDLDHQVPGT